MKTWLKLLTQLSLLTVIAVGCATGRESVQSNALRLEDRAEDFAASVRYTGDDSYRNRLSRDAEALADASRNLNRAAARSSSANMEAEYRQVQREYDRLHKDLTDEGLADQNRRVLQDFDQVTDAYKRVEASMGDRYARTEYRDR